MTVWLDLFLGAASPDREVLRTSQAFLPSPPHPVQFCSPPLPFSYIRLSATNLQGPVLVFICLFIVYFSFIYLYVCVYFNVNII